MVTPFAPWISVTTAWAEMEVAKATTRACEKYMLETGMVKGDEVNSVSKD